MNSELDRKGRPLWFSTSVYLTYPVLRWVATLKVSDFERSNTKLVCLSTVQFFVCSLYRPQDSLGNDNFILNIVFPPSLENTLKARGPFIHNKALLGYRGA